MLECVPNVSEGRDATLIERLGAACGATLLDRHSDPDHHRSVFTICGPEEAATEAGVRALAGEVARLIDLAGHHGVHPRLGALDVVPFVSLPPAGSETVATEAAVRFAAWWAREHDVPVFLYDRADPGGRSLPAVRRGAFRDLGPDYGPPDPHPRLGATAVGARPPLAAVNCLLAHDDLAAARRIAARAREAGGGPPGVRALGLRLAGRRAVQVSMNLCELDRTGLEEACRTVGELARAEGTDVSGVELVGLVPRAVLERCSASFLAWSGLDDSMTIEHRLARSG